MNKILLTACTILLFNISWAQETVEKTFSGVESIRLSTASGDGIIKKGSGKDVKVTLYYTFDDEDFEYTMEQDGTRLRLKEEFENGGHSGTSRWTLECNARKRGSKSCRELLSILGKQAVGAGIDV